MTKNATCGAKRAREFVANACTRHAFNQPIGAWNTSSVTDMSYMFSGATAFNQPLRSTIRAGDDARVGDRWVVDGVEYTIRDRAELRRLIAEKRWAEVERTCTSLITDFSELFRGAEDFNASISHWDTSSVTDMRDMFYAATAFNQPIGDWNTSSVTNMAGMFRGAAAFNQPIGAWNTSSVTNMRAMFYGAAAFNQPIGARSS